MIYAGWNFGYRTKINSIFIFLSFSRFIINIPLERRDDLVQILFAVESAHWFYIDVYCEDDHELNTCNIKDFAQQSIKHTSF